LGPVVEVVADGGFEERGGVVVVGEEGGEV
jgi:hypothetical protein